MDGTWEGYWWNEIEWIRMDMHECAWMDEDGHGGIWISVDGCEQIWMDMNRCGWTWMDVGKCIFQKIAQKKVQPPRRAVELSFFLGWYSYGISMEY